jgi:hypothetical protein
MYHSLLSGLLKISVCDEFSVSLITFKSFSLSFSHVIMFSVWVSVYPPRVQCTSWIWRFCLSSHLESFGSLFNSDNLSIPFSLFLLGLLYCMYCLLDHVVLGIESRPAAFVRQILYHWAVPLTFILFSFPHIWLF